MVQKFTGYQFSIFSNMAQKNITSWLLAIILLLTLCNTQPVCPPHANCLPKLENAPLFPRSKLTNSTLSYSISNSNNSIISANTSTSSDQLLREIIGPSSTDSCFFGVEGQGYENF